MIIRLPKLRERAKLGDNFAANCADVTLVCLLGVRVLAGPSSLKPGLLGISLSAKCTRILFLCKWWTHKCYAKCECDRKIAHYTIYTCYTLTSSSVLGMGGRGVWGVRDGYEWICGAFEGVDHTLMYSNYKVIWWRVHLARAFRVRKRSEARVCWCSALAGLAWLGWWCSIMHIDVVCITQGGRQHRCGAPG